MFYSRHNAQCVQGMEKDAEHGKIPEDSTVIFFIYFIKNFIIFQTRLAGKKKCPSVVTIPVGKRGRLHMQRFGWEKSVLDKV